MGADQDRQDRQLDGRDTLQEQVELLLIEGLESGPATPLDEKALTEIRAAGRELVAERRRGRE
jgi:hypothetical protein